MTVVDRVATDNNLNLTKEKPGLRLSELIDKLYTQGPVVIFVDEYDKPIINNLDNPKVEEILKELLLLKDNCLVLINTILNKSFDYWEN